MEVLSSGFLYKEIADQLHLNIGNVKKRLNGIYKKLKVANRTEAIEIWRTPWEEGTKPSRKESESHVLSRLGANRAV